MSSSDRLDGHLAAVLPGFLRECEGLPPSYARGEYESVRDFVSRGPVEVTLEHFVARLRTAGTVILSDVHGYEPVTRANLWLLPRLLAGDRARYLGIEFLYPSWDLHANDLPERMAVAFPDLQAQGKLAWVDEAVRIARRHRVPLLGLNSEEFNETHIHLRFDLDRVAFAELAADLLRRRDEWVGRTLAGEAGPGVVVYGRAHCLQPAFRSVIPDGVTVFLNDYGLLAEPALSEVLRGRVVDDCVILQLGPDVFVGHVPAAAWGTRGGSCEWTSSGNGEIESPRR